MIATAVSPDFSGKVFDDGRFELLQPVGAGAFGKVYLAIDHHASSSAPARCAVKVVQKAGPSRRDTQSQRREFSIHALVSDIPGVLALRAVHEDDAFFYVVMEYRECDLFELINEGVAFAGADADERIRAAFVQMLDAVHTFHKRKVFHRDLKPENILCSADGREVCVADFGMATLCKRSYTYGCGTSDFMSPECFGYQAACGPYSTKYADIWALGMILFNMITGGYVPWNTATLDDPDFRAFLHDEHYLQRNFPISSGTADLLHRIFSSQPTMRPSISQIREHVLSLTTFFAGEDDVLPYEEDAEEQDDIHGEDNDACSAASDSTPDYEGDSIATSEFTDGPMLPLVISELKECASELPLPLVAPLSKRPDHPCALSIVERLEMLMLE